MVVGLAMKVELKKSTTIWCGAGTIGRCCAQVARTYWIGVGGGLALASAIRVAGPLARIAATYQTIRIATTKVRTGTVRPARIRVQASVGSSAASIAALT